MATPTIQEIDARREAAGITSDRLARRAGSDAATLSRWRNGLQSPTQRTLERVDQTLTLMIEERIAKLRELQP